jgi:hypothetical protein
VHKFLERHKGRIVIRKATNIRRCRAAVSPDDIRAYFANLEKEIQGVSPSNIFNCDESCMRDDPSAKSAFFKKGVRYPEQGGHLFNHSIPLKILKKKKGERIKNGRVGYF